MILIHSIRAKYYKFMFNGLVHRHYELLQKRVDLLERENKIQQDYIQLLEKDHIKDAIT